MKQSLIKKKHLGDFAKKNVLLWMLICMVAVFSMSAQNFFTSANGISILRQVAVLGIMSCGMSFVLIGGNFDFSSASLVEMMSEFRALSTYEKYLLYGLDSEQLYYLGIVLYLSNTYPDTRVSTLAYSLMLVEVYHYTYLQDPTVTVTLEDGSVRTVKELLLETWYSFESDTENGYQTLTTEEQAIFDEYFTEMTEYYRGECNKISAEQ